MDVLPKIEIDGASKTIGNNVVLNQIQLTVEPGEVIGLQGINGSGKTMLLRLIAGLIRPTKGRVFIDGKILGTDLEFPPSLGFLIENPAFLPQYTGAENLQLLSSLHQKMSNSQIESVLQRVGLHDTKYRKYSLGMKQRLGIAAAVFERPDIILLDEPTNALDESGIAMLENVIQEEFSRGATIVLASHDRDFLHHCCGKVYTMRAGHLSL
ncbi:MAG: ABC transporter ATP-binding protein [Gemmiger sp.]